MAKYINLVGVELEGGWIVPPVGIYHDGSVSGVAGHKGEFSTKPPVEPDKISHWIAQHYPDYSNQSCGLHCHISLKKVNDYMRLMTPEFQKHFLQKMEKWGKDTKIPSEHPFWSRLKGQNQYCKRDFIPNDQVTGAGSRYTQLNFAYYKYKTLECRMLPMFPEGSKYAISAIQTYLDCVEEFLDKSPNLSFNKIKEEIPIDEDLVI